MCYQLEKANDTDMCSDLGLTAQSLRNYINTLREESSQTNVILQYKLLEAILSAVCSVIQ